MQLIFKLSPFLFFLIFLQDSLAQTGSGSRDSRRNDIIESSEILEVPSSRNSSAETGSEMVYKLKLEVGKQYRETIEKLKSMSGNSKVKVEYNHENKNYANNLSMYVFKCKVSDSDLPGFLDYFRSLGKIIDSGTVSVNNYNSTDTLQYYREIEMYSLQLVKYKAILDTMSVLDKQFTRIQSAYNSTQRNLDQRYKQLENTRKSLQFNKRIELEIYDNYKKYNSVKKNNWETYFVPGISFSALQPKALDTLGLFSGLTPEITFLNRYKNTGSGPSYIKLYGKLGLLGTKSSKKDQMFMYGLGAIASIENKINRKFAIPYFGCEFGNIEHNKLGNSIYIQPKIGLYLYATKKLQVFAEGGYFYALKNTLEFRTYSASFGFNFLLWH